MLAADFIKAIRPIYSQKVTHNYYHCLKRKLDFKYESVREQLAISQQPIGSHSIESSLGVIRESQDGNPAIGPLAEGKVMNAVKTRVRYR